MQRMKPVTVWGIPVPMPLIRMYVTMLPFIQWFQRATAGYVLHVLTSTSLEACCLVHLAPATLFGSREGGRERSTSRSVVQSP